MPVVRLPLDVLQKWVRLDKLSAPVLFYGYVHGCLSEAQVVRLELARYEKGLVVDVNEEDLALLLPDEFFRVRELLIAASAHVPTDATEPSFLWFYAAARQLLDEWDHVTKPTDLLDNLLEALGLDELYGDLVSYAPRPLFRFRRRHITVRERLEAHLTHLSELLEPRP